VENGSIRLVSFSDFKVSEKKVDSKAPLTSETAEKVRAIIAEGVGKKPEEVGDDDHLMNDLGCDSLTYFGILIKVCNEFNVEVEGPVESKYYTLRDIVTALEARPADEEQDYSIGLTDDPAEGSVSGSV
jgi:acyl carrier protein